MTCETSEAPRPRPLAGVRVLALEQFGAGPFGSLQLAELGADVVKIEDPAAGGDVGRRVPPFAEGEDSLYFETFNRGKRSLDLDLRTEPGRHVFERLVAVSDAVFSNLRGDVPRQIGITYDQLREHNPRIVCCNLSGFGAGGPRATQPGYDIVLQALSGWMAITGEPDAPPTKSGLSLVDYAGGFVAALAILAGLHAAGRDGRGMDCDISLFDTAIGMITYPATWQLTEGYEVERMRASAHPSLVPFQSFRCADGWIVVACAKEKFWHRLCEALGRRDLLDDERFQDFEHRRRHAAAILAELEPELGRRRVDQCVTTLERAGVPCAPVNSIGDALSDPQTAARELVVHTEHPRWGSVAQVRSPVRAGEHPPVARPAPRLGEHRRHVLTEILGYDADRVARLEQGGAFGRLTGHAAA